MGKNVFETLVGAVVLIVAFGFVVIAYKGGNVDVPDGTTLTARFNRIDGLHVGSDVRMSGLVVGSITKQELDPKTYEAIVTFEIDRNIAIPEDSSAEIIGDGLLGAKMLSLVPGGSFESLKDGGEITITQSSISLEALLGKFVMGSADDKPKEEDQAPVKDPFEL